MIKTTHDVRPARSDGFIKTSLGLLACSLVLCCLSSNSQAATIIADTADAQVENSTGSPQIFNLAHYAGRIGEYFSPNYTVYVMPFQLPTLGAGEVFTTADLRTQLFSMGGPPDFNADLYGLGRRASSMVLTTDFYHGPLDGSATLIQDNFLTPASTVRTDPNTGPFITTDAGGDAALVAYLNAQYAGGAGAGEYVFLRISPDATGPQGNEFYEILSADAGGSEEKPLLTYTSGAVPEPSTWALLAIGGVILAIFRRRLGLGGC